MAIPVRLQEQLDDLALFPERQDRIEALISLGDEFTNPSSDEVIRSTETRVPGCESEAYVVQTGSSAAGLKFRIAVDNPQGISAMALAVILQNGCSGASPQDINEISEDVVYDIFGRELSMGKSMGLTGMVRMVKNLAQKA